jgi:hypothetical protein
MNSVVCREKPFSPEGETIWLMAQISRLPDLSGRYRD